MGSDETLNRRKYPRVKTESLVSLARVDGPSSMLANALDLSKGGIRFQCVGLEVEQGETLRVTLTIGERTVCFTGTLVRVTDLDAFTQEVALCFTEIDDDVRELLPDDGELVL